MSSWGELGKALEMRFPSELLASRLRDFRPLALALACSTLLTLSSDDGDMDAYDLALARCLQFAKSHK